VLSEAGERLSKRDKALSLSTLRRSGTDPRQVVAALGRLSGLEAGERCEPRELLDGFSLSKVPRQPVRIAPLAG
jgi:glutamyl/glutaminyl-tRNA synthetase